MKVMCRRGSPSWPMTSETRIAPRPPKAKTRPRSPASPPSSFLTRNGSSTGERARRRGRALTNAQTSVPQSQTFCRTKRRPSAMSRSIDVELRAGCRRGGPRDAAAGASRSRTERRGVDEEGRSRRRPMDDDDRRRPARRRRRQLPDELRERVRLNQQVLRDEVGDDRARRRALERLAGAEEGRDRTKSARAGAARDGKDSEHGDAGAAGAAETRSAPSAARSGR